MATVVARAAARWSSRATQLCIAQPTVNHHVKNRATALAAGFGFLAVAAQQRSVASCSGPSCSSSEIFRHVKVVPYGVLGLSSDGKRASEPDEHTAFVDPAGLHHIQGGGPSGAGGAAGALYKWLGINKDATFPAPVVAAITQPLLAKFHAYGNRMCIHVIGPDFRKRPYTRDEAVCELAQAYRNILLEFHCSGLPRLRLLPVSGGIFSGPFGPQLPELTAEALTSAFGELHPEVRPAVLGKDLELCIFMAKEFPDFEKAFFGSGRVRL
eukprot:TRINITY_DN38000_c0_g1_i1.p1 TRINITY_DN38000_c0_g1~~TRINITY_DN38000_c0_g1_i1.p1  ORF type:complete len:277 (+),score=46.97 TRINITY_DN38000_c0_g1_i1:26-832(+)